MKITEDHWNRWIDGQLSPEDQAAMSGEAASAHPELASEQVFHRRLAEDLRACLPAEQTPPYPDFFNSQIQKRIRDLGGGKQARVRGWASWLRLPWLIPAAVAATLALGAVQLGWFGKKAGRGSQIVHSYVPSSGLQAEVTYHAEANATVLRVEGMAPLPDDFDLKLVNHGSPARAAIAEGRPRKNPPADSGEVHLISLKTP